MSTTSIIRGRHVLTQPLASGAWRQIDDGAILHVDGIIAAIGSFDEIRRENPDVEVVGGVDHVLMPGFVNSHHHQGITPFQLGSLYGPNELGQATRMRRRKVDPYLDTLYSAFELIASGVTTVQHIRGLQFGTKEQAEHNAGEVIRAYEDIGMRVSYSTNVRDQNRVVYQDDAEFTKTLPEDLQPLMAWYYSQISMDIEDHMEVFNNIYSKYGNSSRVKVQLAPANLQWCSDKALTLFSETSQKLNVPLHIHLLETPYQRAYAYKRGGCGAVDYLERFDLLGPRLTLGHAVWVNEDEIGKLAETKTNVCLCCSSNFRLRNGIAPATRFECAGINVAIGIDEAGINDDRDMLQEMRLVLNANKSPGPFDDPTLNYEQILRMATVGGALTTSFANGIGSLAVGKAADIVAMNWKKLSYPFLDPSVSVVNAVVQRGKGDKIDFVMVAGEVIYEEGRFTRVDQAAALEELHRYMMREPDAVDARGEILASRMFPYVKAFYDNYVDWDGHEPYQRHNSRR